MDVYIASIEFDLAESHPEFGKLKGGFVYAFVKAINVESAKRIIAESLQNEFLIPKVFEFVNEYSKMEWETDKDQVHFDQIAIQVDHIHFDDFYMYENQ